MSFEQTIPPPLKPRESFAGVGGDTPKRSSTINRQIFTVKPIKFGKDKNHAPRILSMLARPLDRPANFDLLIGRITYKVGYSGRDSCNKLLLAIIYKVRK